MSVYLYTHIHTFVRSTRCSSSVIANTSFGTLFARRVRCETSSLPCRFAVESNRRLIDWSLGLFSTGSIRRQTDSPSAQILARSIHCQIYSLQSRLILKQFHCPIYSSSGEYFSKSIPRSVDSSRVQISRHADSS